MSKRKYTCKYVSILTFWDWFQSIDFNSILFVCLFLLVFFVVIVLSSIVLLIKNGQFFGCATIALNEWHHGLVFLTENVCVYWAVRSKSLTKIRVKFSLLRPYHGSRRQLRASHRGGPGSMTNQSRWDLWYEKVALGQVFVHVLRFSPISVIPQMLHTHLQVALTRKAIERSLEICLKNNARSEIGDHLDRNALLLTV